jgi:hypothetical protein
VLSKFIARGKIFHFKKAIMRENGDKKAKSGEELTGISVALSDDTNFGRKWKTFRVSFGYQFAIFKQTFVISLIQIIVIAFPGFKIIVEIILRRIEKFIITQTVC